MYQDLEKALKPYFDGKISANEAMHAIASLDERGRGELKKIVFAWIETKITSKQAIAKIRDTYNLVI